MAIVSASSPLIYLGVTDGCAIGHLDAGESEAISLALECKAERLLLDDQRDVSYARRLGIAVRWEFEDDQTL